MNWFYLSLIPPFLFSIANHIDKYLLSKYIKGGGVGSLIIFSCLFSVFILPIYFYFRPDVIEVSGIDIILLIIVGVINTLGVLFYLTALSKEDASIVVPLVQLTPVSGYIFSFLFFNETITNTQFLAALFILMGSVMLCFSLSGEGLVFKWRTAIYMLISTVLFGLHGSLFKFVTFNENFIKSFFWEYVGLLISGICFFVFYKNFRVEFVSLIKSNKFGVFIINSVNETIVFSANIIVALCFTLAPVSLVLAIGSLQSLFVFVIGLLICIFFPKISKEEIRLGYLSYKILAIVIIIYGGYLMSIA